MKSFGKGRGTDGRAMLTPAGGQLSIVTCRLSIRSGRPLKDLLRFGGRRPLRLSIINSKPNMEEYDDHTHFSRNLYGAGDTL